MSQLKRVFIYSDRPSPSLSVEEVACYLRSLDIPAEIRGDFISFLDLDTEAVGLLARRIASTVVYDLETPLDVPSMPEEEDVQREVSSISSSAQSGPRQLYEGNWLQRLFHSQLAKRDPNGLTEGAVHVIFTGRLFVTFEVKRYHARVVLGGSPSLISTSGLVEAPARPREYYLAKASLMRAGRGLSPLDEMFRGRYIAYDDPLVTPALKSYVLQAIFYRIAGQEFCSNPSCCLFNSHWQEEVLSTQVNGGLCESCGWKLGRMLRG